MASQTILLADDEASVREVLRSLLEHEGYQVEEASDGHETIRKAREIEPNLIILDVNMPDLNGYSVLLRMKSRAGVSNVPVIVLSGEFVGEEYERHSHRLGAVHHLEKPVERETLLGTVREVLSEQTHS